MMRSIFTVLSLAPALVLSLAAFAQTPLLLGAKAHAPYLSAAPTVYVVQNGELKPSKGDSIIEESLKEINERFNIRINQKVLAGYIVDLDQSSLDQQYSGFDLDAIVDDEPFIEWFHNPFPNNTDFATYTSSIWTYATTGVSDKAAAQKLTQALAYIQIDHVFFPVNKFKMGFYYDEARNQATNQGLESVLHEALHIWDSRNHDAVLKLLHSQGSYYDRVAISKQICPFYTNITSLADDNPRCGFQGDFDAMIAVLRAAKWPQRYGALTQRKRAKIKDQYGCSSFGPEAIVEGQLVCVGENKGQQMGDLHAVDSEFEYFAILMQLYVFSPNDFKNAATPTEAAFAADLFSTYMN